MRLVGGSAMITHGFTGLRAGVPVPSAVLGAIEIIAGILLLAGLGTPISGTLAAVLGIWSAVSQPGDPWSGILRGTIGAGLALVGPGAWSVDARLFGWRRIELRDRG